MATSDKTGPDDEVVEGSWSPKRSKASSKGASKASGEARSADASPDPEVLAGEIEKTREELAETLDAIAEKVSPKRVTARTKQAAKDGAADAVESVKETAASAADAVKGGVTKAKEKVAEHTTSEPPVVVATTPGALADTAAVPLEPVGAETPVYSLPPAAPSRAPVYAGAAAAALVAFWLLRRGRR